MPAETLASGPPRAEDRDQSVGGGRLVLSELRVLFGRVRTLVLLLILAATPVLLAVAVRLSSGDSEAGEGPPFVERIAGNGLFVVITGLATVMPFFLPLTVGVVAGDTIAGEASQGTLRYLLVVPAGRVRLLVAKYVGVLAFCFAATLTVALVGLGIGLALFPVGDLVLLSGDTLPLGSAMVRALLVALYVAVSMAGLGAIGLFVSTLTDTPVGAMAATVTLAIVSQILGALPQLEALHPYLFTSQWLAFVDLLRDPVPLDDLGAGLVLQAAYVAVFGLAAWARFTTRDVLA